MCPAGGGLDREMPPLHAKCPVWGLFYLIKCSICAASCFFIRRKKSIFQQRQAEMGKLHSSSQVAVFY